MRDVKSSYLPPDPNKRHILGLSGGKDSTALAVYLRDRVPQLEYVFCDTHEELPETYEYLDQLETVLKKKIVRLNAKRPFEHFLQIYRGVLPDARARWCTRMLKLKPFEEYVGEGAVVSYVGIRADENRSGYISTKPNIEAVFPFKEDGKTRADIKQILEDAGVGLPDYYSWRSRSGCYFCFFQQRIEWVGLLEEHPELFEKAKAFEKSDEATGQRFTWNQRESLEELSRPERVEQIKREHAARMDKERARRKNLTMMQSLGLSEIEDGERGCDICHL